MVRGGGWNKTTHIVILMIGIVLMIERQLWKCSCAGPNSQRETCRRRAGGDEVNSREEEAEITFMKLLIM